MGQLRKTPRRWSRGVVPPLGRGGRPLSDDDRSTNKGGHPTWSGGERRVVSPKTGRRRGDTTPDGRYLVGRQRKRPRCSRSAVYERVARRRPQTAPPAPRWRLPRRRKCRRRTGPSGAQQAAPNGGRPEDRDDLVNDRTQRARAATDHDAHHAESASRRRRGAAAKRHQAASDAAARRARRAHELRRVERRRESSATAAAPKNATTSSRAARRERAPPPTTTRTALRARAAAAEERRPRATTPHRMRRHGGRVEHARGAAWSGAARAARRRPPRRT